MNGEHHKIPLVLTGSGKDRVGVTAAIAELIFKNGGRIEHSRMTKLGGNFTIMMSLFITEEGKMSIEREKDAFGKKQGFDIITHEAFEEAPKKDLKFYKVRLCGADAEGVLFKLTSLFAEKGINIDELESWTEEAPISGGKIFKLQAAVELPEKTNIEELSKAIDELGTKEGVECWMESPEQLENPPL